MKAIAVLLLASSIGLFTQAAPKYHHEYLKPADSIEEDVDFQEVYVGDYYDLGVVFQFTKDMNFIEISKTGDAFSIAHNCPAMLPSGKRCFLYFIFEPTAEGDATGEVTVKTDDNDYTFHLKGTGVPPDGGGNGGGSEQ